MLSSNAHEEAAAEEGPRPCTTWLTRSTIWRLVVATAIMIPMAVALALSGKRHSEHELLQNSARNRRALLSAMSSLNLGRLSRQTARSGKTAVSDTDLINITVVLEHVEIGPQTPGTPWMFSTGDSPFEETNSSDTSFFANARFSWNADGKGNGSCESAGSGEASRGYIDPYHNFLNLSSDLEYTQTTATLDGLELAQFDHINAAKGKGKWDVMGEAGDTRRYKNGVFEVRSDEKKLLRATKVQWIQNMSYPAPAGAAKSNVFEVSAYFVGAIDVLDSDPEWLSRLDPSGVGYILGIVTGGSFGRSTCYTANSYWITLRGFPDFGSKGQNAFAGGSSDGDRGVSGSKIGDYPGSSEAAISTARALAAMAKTVVTGVTVGAVGGAVASAGFSAATGGGPSPAGNGVSGLLVTAAFAAKISQIPGFHTDAMKEFGSGLDSFLVRFPSPLTEKGGDAGVTRNLEANEQMIPALSRQESDSSSDEEHPQTISDDLMKGCAFWCTIVILAFAAMHLLIWIATRKKPIETQLKSHAWMIYLFSIAMSYIYTASVLASVQYFRSHVPYGTGKIGIYIAAAAQLFVIGLGFTVFFFAIMGLAIVRMQREEVRWVPKEYLADPELRRSAIIAGEYEAEEHVWFHQLFSCYYNAMAGPRIWLVAMELAIVFLDALFTALIWNDLVCLGLLISIYAVMFCLFVALAPFVDRRQGVLVAILGFTELCCLILELIGALGDFTTAERCEMVGVILGFVAIGLAVIIALYCDVIPTFQHIYHSVKRRRAIRKHGFDPAEAEQENLNRTPSGSSSEWSGLRSDSDDQSTIPRTNSYPTQDEANRDERYQFGEIPGDSDALVQYNARRELETQETMKYLFADGMSKRRTESPGSGSPRSGSPDRHPSRRRSRSSSPGDSAF